MSGLPEHFLSLPFIAPLALAAGWIGVLVEFLRPGWVIPGVLGGVLLLAGLSRMLPSNPGTAAVVSLPFLFAAAWLLRIAWRARRNKWAL